MDYIEALFTDFSEIHGDRRFSDDAAMTAGMARFHGEPVMVIGNLKGRSLKERVARKFGSPDPEGYRKALRTMRLAEKYGRPIFTFIDLAGANPGLGAEERGQGEAIARNLLEMSRLRVPTIATITGEGGSGGALALAVADRVLMLENAIYSVISPEGCASIMWKDASKKQQASVALRYTATDVQKLGCVDDVIREPEGGTHNDPAAAMLFVNERLERHLRDLKRMSIEDMLAARYAKFRNIAQFYTQD
jgi:acetyl-CoA carboxylase carboxyl transferase subunit alpha